MVKFNIREIKKLAEEDYEKAWVESGLFLKREGKIFSLTDKQKEHPLFNLFIKVRNVLLSMGFTEIVVPMIIEEAEIYRQYGPEAPVILDRVFYLAGLPRPDIGIGKKKIKEIKRIIPRFDMFKELKEIFRRYKKAEIEADDLIEEMISKLKIKEEEATRLLGLFPELKKLKPLPTKLTLRSHTTAGWFIVLKEMQKREQLPIQLFSIGTKFRREQKLDPTHLYNSFTASIVIMNDVFSLEDGKDIAREILNKLGFKKIKFITKKATSKYYAPQTELEVFIKHPKTGEWLEVGDLGFYSPVSLANYDIEYPVFNFGFGLERIAMIITGEKDIRKLVYPYLYKEIEFSDEEIAKSIKMIKKPETREGKKLAKIIYEAALKHKDDDSPVEVLVYDGKLLGKRMEIRLFEDETNKKLLSFAAFNPIVVKNGNILGAIPDKIPPDSKITSLNYTKALSSLVAYEAERLSKSDKKRKEIRIKIVKRLRDINLTVSREIEKFIQSNGKKIDIRGPVFLKVRIRKV